MSSERPHFVLLQHGSQGAVTDFTFIIEELVTRHGYTYCREPTSWWRLCGSTGFTDDCLRQQRLLFDSTANHRILSDGGVDVCTERLMRDVVPMLERFVEVHASSADEGTQLVDFSCVGHSLGGILLRRFLQLMRQRHAALWNALRCNVFVTIATPHLGSRGIWSAAAAGGRLLARVYSQTFADLFLMGKNGGPLATELVSDGAIDALAAFRKRRLYANLSKDLLVPFTSASLMVEGDRAVREAHPERQPTNGHMFTVLHLKAGDVPRCHEETPEVVMATALRARLDFEVVPTLSRIPLPFGAHATIISLRLVPWIPTMDDVGRSIADLVAE
jgi:hypothetical protein